LIFMISSVTPRPPRSSTARHLLAVLAAGALARAVACGSEEASPEPAPTEPPGAVAGTPGSSNGGGEPASGAATPNPTTAAAASPPARPADPQQRLRLNLLSSLTVQSDPATVREALEEIEVIAIPIPDDERDLWIAVTSGPGIWSLDDDQVHVVAVYELRPDQTWVEVSIVPLASTPTLADIEVALEDHGEAAWFAVHGFTGAHSGTFELLRFDGAALTSVLWWFSPSPGAGYLEDLDGDGLPEVILNATDPYIYCYACGVRAWDELIYRWVDADLVEVARVPVPHTDQAVVALTSQAAMFARADLWRHAEEVAALAVDAAPGDADVRWLHRAIARVAAARLEDAGASSQPLLTNVLAGEYAAAVDLMRAYPPLQSLSPSGPLIAGTVAETGWESVTGDYLVEYATRALDAEPALAAAYAVRAYGHLLLDPDAWAAALADMERALLLEPGDTFYAEATDFLRERAATGG
jgi:hypothetical protein